MANVPHRAAAHSDGVFKGKSPIGGPRARTLAGPASRDKPEILTSRIDLAAAGRKDLNAFNSLLRDRRADVYG